MATFQIVEIRDTDPPLVKRVKMRVNGLGSLYYFNKVILKRKRLREHLHRPWCESLERDHIKDVYEYPRDHFKTTICSEGLPMWRSLPFSDQDEEVFRKLGYDDSFIAFMKRMHRQDVRNILVAENITNAAKLGKRISGHYESNAIFRLLFPEILPDSSCVWSNYGLHHKRGPSAAPHGEGTYDFLGVGGALQSRHYDGLLIQDDLVGRKAIESISVMEKTIDYHKLVVGAFENPDENTHENSELVIGNRWAYTDLNSHIREHEPWFRFVTHSALGGCCPLHLPDTPILPEEFSFEKLMRLKERLGTYYFSCFPAGAPVLMSNLTQQPIECLKVGDEIVGYDLTDYPRLVRAHVEGVHVRRAPVVEFQLASGKKIRCTYDHKWLKRFHREPERGGPYAPLMDVVDNKVIFSSSELVAVYQPGEAPTPEKQRILDWLGGILDGEGSVGSTIAISQSPTKNPEVWAGIRDALLTLGIHFEWRDDCDQFIIHGGRSLKIFLVKYAKLTKLERFAESFWKKPGGIAEDDGFDKVVTAVWCGEEDVYNIQSSSGNYVAYGFATKNCQYLNNPAAPENADFREAWLNHFTIEEPNEKNGFQRMIRHETRDGVVRKDFPFKHLVVAMSVDPNHSGNAGLGRCRHAIPVVGLSSDGCYYLLDCFAEGCSYDKFYNTVFEKADKWNLTKIGVETIAAQRYIGHHIQQMGLLRGRPLRILELKGEVEGPDGEMTRKKECRIRNVLTPIFENGRFYTQRKFQDFFGEYTTFPKGRYVDILDAMAYIPGMLRTPQRYETYVKSLQMNQRLAQQVNRSYCVPVQ